MSDAGRSNITDKISAAVKPDSEKSTTEHIGDAISGKADNVAGKAEGEQNKSTLQSVADKVFGGNSK
ncbi:heat shock protein 9/12 [Dacryopinax primogenitus]|uniref:Heat shock protein 9/12 n=1 Tax=Dacryopinax primogenitus (strain DJM 731) TaxID=1858805 RepID=M5GDC1_DACPD|nr:heat shock protein 9/12 [Dacryopinax primogenitus]EJU04422.1 heat shock protein 9/12 [Dacryopinax primogenitus]